MKSKVGLAVLLGLIVGLSTIALAEIGLTVLVQKGAQVVELALDTASPVTGMVAYQGPVFNADNENWKETHTYSGVLIRDLLSAVDGMSAGDRLAVVATDGYYKEIPYEALYGSTPAGDAILYFGALIRDLLSVVSEVSAGDRMAVETMDGYYKEICEVLYGTTLAGDAILALTKDGESTTEGAPTLVFLPEDELFSNDDMLSSFGEDLSHYYSGRPSTTGMMVKDVAYLIVNYDGGALPERMTVGESTILIPGGGLTVVAGEMSTSYTIADLEGLDVVTAEGTFTNTIGVDYTATYTGVPIATLIGNVPVDTTILVTAADGYSMNYEAGMFLDRSEGTWILAYKENGFYMPYDPGPLRIVLVGENNPRFEGAISAKMVTRINILGTYEDYSLLMHGAITRAFSRAELEAGVGCPCHTSTVTVTSKGETHTYTGLPLWQLIAYVDDDRAPGLEQGIHYDDDDFNDALAASGYTITLVAEDGYTQSVFSQLIAHDDRFIVAFKRDGLFLDPAESGYMRFVYDDSVLFPAGTSLRSVKFLSSIEVELQ